MVHEVGWLGRGGLSQSSSLVGQRLAGEGGLQGEVGPTCEAHTL
jgi:hypothetical protein